MPGVPLASQAISKAACNMHESLGTVPLGDCVIGLGLSIELNWGTVTLSASGIMGDDGLRAGKSSGACRGNQWCVMLSSGQTMSSGAAMEGWLTTRHVAVHTQRDQ